MTKELAIKILSTRDRYGCLCGWTSGYTEALDMAIEALKERPKGKWTKISNTVPCMNCPICGSTFTLILGGDKMNYCPNCGADMRGDTE